MREALGWEKFKGQYGWYWIARPVDGADRIPYYIERTVFGARPPDPEKPYQVRHSDRGYMFENDTSIGWYRTLKQAKARCEALLAQVAE